MTDIIARGMAASMEGRIATLAVEIQEIFQSFAEPYDETKTYTTGVVVSYQGKIYRATKDIPVPEPFDPDHWEQLHLEDEIHQLREAIAGKQDQLTAGTGIIIDNNTITYDEVEVSSVEYVDANITDTMNFIIQERDTERAARVAGDELLQTAINTKVSDAPSDDQMYVRKNSGWVALSTAESSKF